jgi:hypothetical protein
MSKKVLMHVDANGVTKIEAQGYEGGTCLDATAVFEGLFKETVKPREMVGACAPGRDLGERVR